MAFSSPTQQRQRCPTFTVWIQPDRDEADVRKFGGVREVVKFPHEIRVIEPDGIERYASGEIVRVRQEGVDSSPEPGFRLIFLPEGEVRDVVDAIRLPTGQVKAARYDGEQIAAEGRIAWLKSE